jgi:hypothetical protein
MELVLQPRNDAFNDHSLFFQAVYPGRMQPECHYRYSHSLFCPSYQMVLKWSLCNPVPACLVVNHDPRLNVISKYMEAEITSAVLYRIRFHLYSAAKQLFSLTLADLAICNVLKKFQFSF